jgi:hypothetical protein
MTYGELQRSGKIGKSLDKILFDGSYPTIFDRGLEPHPWHGNYVRTYLERDVRQLIKIQDLGTFQRFLKLCAGRTGQLLNLSSLANDSGVTHNTAKAWISVLEASYIVHLLPPHHQNFNKRLVKTPKLYFLDTGLATLLLGIQNNEQLTTHIQQGALFETWVISLVYVVDIASLSAGLRSRTSVCSALLVVLHHLVQLLDFIELPAFIKKCLFRCVRAEIYKKVFAPDCLDTVVNRVARAAECYGD